MLGAYREGLEPLIEARTGDEGLGGIRATYDRGAATHGNVDGRGLSLPDRGATADGFEGLVRQALAAHLHIDAAMRRYQASLVAGHIGDEALAALEPHDVEICQRHIRIVATDNGGVAVVVVRNVHGHDC